MSKLDALFAYMEAVDARNAIDAELRHTPARQKLNGLSKTLKEEQETVKKLTTEMDNRAAQVKKLTERLAAIEREIELEQEELDIMTGDEETTAEEMTETRADIEKLNREAAGLLKDAKAVNEALEKAIQEYRTVAGEYKQNKEAYDQLRTTCEQEKADAAGRIETADAEVARRAKQVEPALLAKFARSAKHNQNAVVPVRERQCSGCNMQLPTATLKMLATPGATVECEHCGRVLYIKEILD